MLLSDAGFVCLASLLHVLGVLGIDMICALTGSTVELPCSSKELKTKPRDGANGLRSISVDGNRFDDSTLTLRDLRQSDSNTYYCGSSEWNRSRGIRLQVTDLEVKVLESLEDSTVTLHCSTSCSLKNQPGYIWYEDNSQSGEQDYDVPRNPDSSYSCSIKDQTSRSPAVCVVDGKCWIVNYVNRRICSLKGSTVNISSSFSPPSSYEVTYGFWFTEWKGGRPQDLKGEENYRDRVEYIDNVKNTHILRIKHLTKEDSAEYIFRFLANTGSTQKKRYAGVPGVILTVTDLKVNMIPSTTVTEGGRVALSCITSCPLTEDPTFIWYHNGRPLTLPEHRHDDPLVLDPVSSRHKGKYSCSVRNHRDLRSPEEALTVRYPPATPSLTESPSGEMEEGGSVTLTCSSDAEPPAEYTWYKENIDSSKAEGQNYTITNITSEDFGAYYCQAWNQFGRETSTSFHIPRKAFRKTTFLRIVISVSLVALSSICLLIMKRKNCNCTATGTEQTGQSFPLYDNIATGTRSSDPARAKEARSDCVVEELL